ncbi:MAG: hypothetical protein IJX20_01025 [Alphaproteobacteria bacterium]|nr:hypothetical protein [Alphaproteobacteria bacterium]
MKFTTALMTSTLLTILTACGGGGGGGHGNIPNTTLPNIVNPTEYNAQITSMQATDETNVKALVEYSETNAPSTYKLNKRMMAARSSETDIDQNRIDAALEKYENMYKILIEHNFDGCTEANLNEAIMLSGYDVSSITEDVSTLDKLKTWIDNNIDELSLKAQRVYDMYGEVKVLAQDNAIINVVNMDVKQDSYVSFKLKDDGSIENLYFDVDTDSSDARRMNLVSNGNGVFSAKKTNYVYGVRLDDGLEVYIEDFNTLEYTKNHWNEFKEKLLANLDERIQESGQDYSDKRAEFEIKINELEFEKDFANNKCETGECTETKEIYYAGGDNVETKVTYESKAKNSGLLYSDFGTVDIKGMEGFLPVNEKFVFAGGMDAKRIDKVEIQGDMTFSGNAVATVIHQDYTGEERVENTKTFDGSANLVFNNGAETLTTKFDNWYYVTVTSNANQNDYNITFENNTISDDDKNYYQFNNNDTYTVSNFINERNNGRYGAVDIGYYGENGTPEEATGFVAYGESIAENVALNAQIGFGAVKQ